MIRSALLHDSGWGCGVENHSFIAFINSEEVFMGYIGVGNVMLLFTDTLLLTQF